MEKKIETLLIPVENQVRELDPKLLLALIAARHGFTSIIGSRREMEMGIDAYPPSIYLSKSMTVRSLLFFQVAHRLGHKIITWDEEALVHLPPETYYSRRLHPTAIKYVDHLFAWGEDNAELWRQYTHLPADTPIHVVGNPRGDLLRPELRTFYQAEADDIRRAYGDFILVNTNFNHVNAFGPDMNLFKPVERPGQTPKFGRAARGMSRTYAEGLRDHKLAVFEDFKRLIPRLAEAFPNYTIVVRPHPTENHAVYQQLAQKAPGVEVTNKGNVVPWLLSAQALIHNGCTTGIEAYTLGVPAISYRASIDETYDNGFYQLPNKMSHQTFTVDELIKTLADVLAGEMGPADGIERENLIATHLAAQRGPLACERIIDVIAATNGNGNGINEAALTTRARRRIISLALRLVRRYKAKLPGSHNRPEFQKHRYPGVAIEEVRDKLQTLQRAIGDKTAIEVDNVTDKIFKIWPAKGA